ncbi:NAIP [Mytilus coruscus]|uniref:NAIP n=1 Tax=Mytilus coruscus TaxID=42192 RepID=A0A6J8CRH8_MYTCO|nr:NAIP [Mytilus coruscus]
MKNSGECADTMDKLIYYLFLLSFIVCVFAKVEWKVEKKISRYGEDLRLFCIADNYAFDGVEIKRWEGGPKQKMLTLNGAPDQEDVMKYDMSMREDGFDLVIKNVTKVDLNVTYGCTYGFKSSGKVILKIEDAFEVRQIEKPREHVKSESKGTNNVIIYVVIALLLVLAVAVIVILLILHHKGKLSKLKKICGRKANSEHKASEGQQETDHCLQQLNGLHISNGGTSVAREAEEDDSLLSQPNEGNLESMVDDLFVSLQHNQPELIKRTNTVEPCNTEQVVESSNDNSLQSVTTPKDPASCTFTEVNECNSLLQQQIGGHEEGTECKDVAVVAVAPQSELIISVTGSKTKKPCNTESDGESDETSLKDVTAVGDPASSTCIGTLTASVPGRGFQNSKSDEQENKMPIPENAKFNGAYKRLHTREKSFKSHCCKWTLSQPPIQQMAKAGFFCNGYQTMVQCYSCGSKRYWQEGDDPFDDHFHENCRHLKHLNETQA